MRKLLCVLLFFFCSLPSFAQFMVPTVARPFDSIGPTELTGVVSGLPQDDRNCTVELRDVRTMLAVGRVDCLDNGSFVFRQVPSGEYQLVLFWGTNQFSQEITLLSSHEEISINIPNSSGSNSISVSELRVPEKAKEECRKASASMSKADWDKADRHITEALRIAPKFARAMAMRAMLFIIHHDFRSALDVATAAAATDPTLGIAQFVRASAFNALGQPKPAQVAAEHGLRLTADVWQGHFELAKALAAQQDYRNALVELNRAAAKAPESVADIFLLRASVLFNVRDFHGSQQNLEEFSKLRPGDPRASQLEGLLATAAR